jgi:ribonuclease-3
MHYNMKTALKAVYRAVILMVEILKFSLNYCIVRYMSLPDLSLLEGAIGVTFTNVEFLREALTHRSYLNENRNVRWSHNERSEFLGDAVLELVVTEHLFKTFPEEAEGRMTAYRSALVNTISLSEVAGELHFDDYLLMSKGEARDKGRARQVILANTFEAVIGAIYRDKGLPAAHDFIARFLLPRLKAIVDDKLWLDAKSAFQEEAQDRVAITPMYKALREIGPDHDKIFEIGVYLGDELVSTGQGKSKQDAEQAAARAALTYKGWIE